MVRLPGRAARHRRPADAPAERDVGRPAAALRLRPGPDQPARPRLRRRADGQPGLELHRRDAVLPAAVGDRVRPVDRHGDPRPPRGVLRRPGRLPGRRQHRRRAGGADAGLGPGADPDAGRPDMWRVTIKGLLAAQAPPGADGAGHRARRDVHRRDVRPDRHAAQHVRHALREHLPEHRLPGARGGPVRERRHRDAESRPRVAPGHRATRSRAWRPPRAR